jgi:carbamoyltransferase
MKENEEIDYMEKAFRVRKEKQNEIPAAVHNDGTGRLQTVDKRDNPLFYGLIKAFEDKTGIPVIINTSFNIKGSPIVCTPGDALKTFFTSGLDVLVIGNCIIEKGASGNS